MADHFSNWRSVRMWESRLVRDLRQRRMLRLHGWCIGLITLAITWGVSAVQLYWGGESLALRYLLSLGVGYLAFLLMVRLWAQALLRRDNDGLSEVPDLSGVDVSDCHGGSAPSSAPDMHSGGGGDFAGGGASGDFSGGVADSADGLGNVVGGAMEAAAGSDEAAVVVVPVVAVFLLGCALFLGAGMLVALYFGWEVLLAVAVELAFSYATARTAVRVSREGWVSAAVRLTWKPLAGAVVCAVVLGAALDYWVPNAQSLPQAWQMLKMR